MYTSLHAHTYKHLPLLSAKQSWIAQFSLFKKKKKVETLPDVSCLIEFFYLWIY